MKKRILALVLSVALLMSTVPGTIATSAASDSSTTQVVLDNTSPTETNPSDVIVCENCGAEGHTDEDCEACTECKQVGTHAEGCTLTPLTDGTEPQPCTTCGVTGCTSTHENWCAECQKDDCGVDHTTEPTTPSNTVSGNDADTEPTTEPATQPTTEPTVTNCEYCGVALTEDAVHTDDCLTNCTCEPVEGVHQGDCVFAPEVKTCEHCGVELTEETEHTEDCPLYVALLIDQLLAVQDLNGLYELVFVQDNAAVAYAAADLSYDELEEVVAHIEALYAAEEAPDDILTERYEMLVEVMTSYMECPDCGEAGGEHTEDCPRWQAETIANISNQNQNWSGNKGANTFTGTNIITLTGNVTLTGKQTISSGTTTIQTNGTAYTISRGNSFNDNMFEVATGAKLVINGSNGRITIDGGARNVAGSIILCNHSLDLDYVTLQNNYKQGTDSLTEGGAIQVTSRTVESSVITLDNCNISHCTAEDGSAMMLSGAGKATITITKSILEHCTAVDGGHGGYGGLIRANGNGLWKLTVQDCVMRNNTGRRLGGGIYWCPNADNQYLKVIDCHIIGNTSTEMGGGMFLEGKNMTISGNDGTPTPALDGMKEIPSDGITGTLIMGNSSPYGGGVAFKSYASGGNGERTQSDAHFEKNVVFKDNEAEYGAGLAFRLDASDNYANGAKFDFYLEGADFEGNDAEKSGGAVYIEKKREDYVVNVYMSDGEISNNTAKNGGAIAIGVGSGVTTGGNFTMSGGELISNTAGENGGAVYLTAGNCTMSNGTVTGNSAKNGGAVYVAGGNFAMSGGTVTTNTASVNGGAAYVSGGKITMSGGTMTSNTATGNGGGAYVSGGNFDMTGGTITKNKAAANGGGAYVSGTFTMNNGTISGNTAVENGGGAYVANGIFTMYDGLIGGQNASNSAKNGGGAYVNNGNFVMISGTLAYNQALEVDAGTAEAGTQGYGGGVFAHGGNITIGVENCTGSGATHTTGDYTNKNHPKVIDNTAKFGGGLAADGGVIDIHCGTIVTNNAMNNGAGTNIFMYDNDTTDDTAPVLNHNAGTVGEHNNHGMVVIGGTMNIPYEDGQIQIKINYHDNDEDLTFNIWVSEAPEYYYLNLPYCPTDWETEQNKGGLTFIGWTYDTITSQPPVEDTVDLSFIRDKNDYKALGDPVQIKKKDWKQDNDGYFIDFYAVWAPLSNNVAYDISLDNYGKAEDVESQSLTAEQMNGNTESYTFSHEVNAIISMTNPSIPGYKFVGWKLTPSSETISNWSDGDNLSDETVVFGVDNITSGTAQTAGYGYKYENEKFILTTDRNFGDIKLTALFEEETVDYTYTLVGPDGATNFGQIFAEDASEDYKNVTANKTYTVTIGKVTGDPGKATATAEYGFKLKDPNGWFTDETGTTAVNSAWVKDGVLTPVKVNDLYEGGTFYAVIEYHLADLIISKTATGSYIDNKDHQQTFIFEVYQSDRLLTTVALQPGESVTIKDLTIGTTYTVKEVGGWSWRFDSKTKTHTMIPNEVGKTDTNTVSFVNEQNKFLWLSDDAFVLNQRKKN